MAPRTREFKIGLFVLVGVAALVWLILVFGKLPELLETTYDVMVYCDRAPGVTEGTPVRISGIRIGQVKRVLFRDVSLVGARPAGPPPAPVWLVLRINSRYLLRTDSTIHISPGPLGDTYVDVTPGDANSPLLRHGQVMAKPAEVGPEVSETIRTLQRVAQSLHQGLGEGGANVRRMLTKTELAVEQFRHTMQGVQQIVGDEANQANIRATLANVEKITGNVETITAQVRAELPDLTRRLHTAVDNFNRLCEKVGVRGESALNKSVEAMDKAAALFDGLNRFVEELRQARGTIDKVFKDPALYDNLALSSRQLVELIKEMRLISQQLKVFSERIRRNPFLLLFESGEEKKK